VEANKSRLRKLSKQRKKNRKIERKKNRKIEVSAKDTVVILKTDVPHMFGLS
jgi:hypothetical protein